MASLIENLMDLLEKEQKEYERLLKLSMNKTPIIIRGDAAELQKITDEEQIVVSTVNRLSKQRETVMSDIANVMNKDVNTLKLTNIIEMLNNRKEEQKRLATLRDQLKNTMENVNRSNLQNKELLENALEMVDFDINLIRSMKNAPETAEYNKGAFNTGNVMGNFNGGFDAKQ